MPPSDADPLEIINQAKERYRRAYLACQATAFVLENSTPQRIAELAELDAAGDALVAAYQQYVPPAPEPEADAAPAPPLPEFF